MMVQRQPTNGLSLSNVLIRLGDVSLIALTADVPPGSVVTVMGPSGSGKSTLLCFIGGFLDPVFDAKGTVFVDGVDLLSLEPQARRAGILFQDPLLFPHMSVGANVAFAIPADVRDRRQRRPLGEAHRGFRKGTEARQRHEGLVGQCESRHRDDEQGQDQPRPRVRQTRNCPVNAD
jgi:ABC-type uncharacterized transport system YnjBCD ATPase subunit